MIPRLRPQLGIGEILDALRAGSTVQDFETAFADLAGQKHALAFPYGRTGLMLLLKALGLQDREVICPAYTCVVVAHAIVKAGSIPVFVDSEPNGLNMDLELAERAITRNTGAVVATSIHGYPVDLDRLCDMQKRHPDLIIIQDCAHSFFAEWNDRPVQREGKAAIYGLNISKIMTSIFGGMVTTDDRQLYEDLIRLRNSELVRASPGRNIRQQAYIVAAATALTPPIFSVVKAIQRAGLIDRFTKYYDEYVIDMPEDHLVAMGNAAATLGCSQCEKYADIVARRRVLARTYDARLRGVAGISVPETVPGATYSHYVARVENADHFVAEVAKSGVELGRVIDYCVPDMPAYKPYATSADFPVTRRLNSEVVNLPLGVTDRQAQQVVKAILRALERRKSGTKAQPSPPIRPFKTPGKFSVAARSQSLTARTSLNDKD
jgi:dTDP-4-amino-4,6-dideoxygalactose transaminase